MKRFFVCAVLFAAMFLTVSCGGGSGSDDNNSGGSSGTSVCSYGTYECHGNNSYVCGYGNGSNDLMWMPYEQCSNGCDSWTGKCNDASGTNDGNTEDSGNNENSENSEEPEHICDNGEYSCSGNARIKCQSNSWVFSETCENGCANGECNSCTPQCSGKECGLDGCGGVCGNCDGGYDCTPAGECVRNNTCSKHEDCTDEGMICYQNYCQSPWNKQWEITFEEAGVTDRDPDGACWDGTGIISCGLPDLFAVVTRNGNEIYRTGHGQDHLSVTWNDTDTINFITSTDTIRYCLYDADANVLGEDTDSSLNSDDFAGCFEHDFDFFVDGSRNYSNNVIEYFKISIKPAW